MQLVKRTVTELVQVFLSGVGGASVFALLLFVVGCLVGSGGLANGVEVAKNGTLIISAAALFILAGMLLMKGKQEAPAAHDAWHQRFQCIGYKLAMAMIGCGFIVVASVLDAILMML